MRYLRYILFTTILALLLLLTFIAGYLYHAREYTLQSFPLLNEAYEILNNHGLKPVPASPALEYGMIHGMLQAYDDPYTVFVEPPQAELQTNALEGKFGGIGVSLERDPEGHWSLYPFPDSPAILAGILDGDRLLAVDDLAITPQTPADAIQAAVRGPVGQKVRITVGRPPDYTPIRFSVERQEIAIPSVTWRLAPDEGRVGVVKVNLIAATTADEIQNAVADLQGRGASHFILDLRDNPGGYLNAGVDIARLFLESGDVMQQQYRGKDVETYRVERPGPLADLPLVVLINPGSASAAEIAAGALQASQRAPLIGQHSFGKDSIQLVFNLQDKSSMHVTAAHWWTPGLPAAIKGVGLQPDIIVDPPTDPAAGDTILQAAVLYLMKNAAQP